MTESLAELYANSVREKNNRSLMECKAEEQKDITRRMYGIVELLETLTADFKGLIKEREIIDKE